VRMRHRRAVAQRNRNGRGMGNHHPGAKTPTPTAIHAHCLLLYFSQLNVAPLCAPPSRRFLGLPFYNQPSIALRFFPCRLPCQTKWKTGSGARQGGICNRKYGAAPTRRTHERSSIETTNTGHDKPGRTCPGIQTLMPTAFHAHCLLLYCVQPVSSQRLESAVRVLAVTA
jgi:hypothetical protein